MTAVGLLALFGAWLATWLAGSLYWLVDPALQNDDARSHLFPFHRYGEGTLADDPVAQEMLAQVPPGFHLVYRLLVPVFDLFVAAKVVQGACLALVFVAAWLTGRRRGGLVVGLLLVGLTLHDSFVVDRMAGGLQRAFGFPLLLLHGTGLLDRAFRRRALAAIAGALVYPPALLLMLGAEGLALLVGSLDLRRRSVRRRWGRAGLLTACCVVLVVAFLGRTSDAGPTPTLEQARAMNAFERAGGRSEQLPFRTTLDVLVDNATRATRPTATADASRPLVRWSAEHGVEVGLGLWATLVVLLALRLTRAPPVLACPLVAALVLYWLARALAFKLYTPDRYANFGITAAAILLLAVLVGRVGPRLRRPFRFVARAATAAAFMLGLVVLTGDGHAGLTGQTIDRTQIEGLVEALRRLPPDARVAAHPVDGDHVPFWAARASVTGVEVTNPWRLAAWERELERFRETLDALHATDRNEVLEFARRRDVTHLLLHDARYDPRALPQSLALTNPMNEHVKAVLLRAPWDEWVLRRPPPESITWREPPWTLVDVSALERAWVGDGARPATP